MVLIFMWFLYSNTQAGIKGDAWTRLFSKATSNKIY